MMALKSCSLIAANLYLFDNSEILEGLEKSKFSILVANLLAYLNPFSFLTYQFVKYKNSFSAYACFSLKVIC